MAGTAVQPAIRAAAENAIPMKNRFVMSTFLSLSGTSYRHAFFLSRAASDRALRKVRQHACAPARFRCPEVLAGAHRRVDRRPAPKCITSGAGGGNGGVSGLIGGLLTGCPLASRRLVLRVGS